MALPVPTDAVIGPAISTLLTTDSDSFAEKIKINQSQSITSQCTWSASAVEASVNPVGLKYYVIHWSETLLFHREPKHGRGGGACLASLYSGFLHSVLRLNSPLQYYMQLLEI